MGNRVPKCQDERLPSFLVVLEKESGRQPITRGAAKLHFRTRNRDWDGSLQALVSSAPSEVGPAPSAFPGAPQNFGEHPSPLVWRCDCLRKALRAFEFPRVVNNQNGLRT